MTGSLGRTTTVAKHEFRTAWRRVSTWVLLFILAFLAWGFIAGGVTISSGGTSVGAERPHVNSMFNIAFTQMLMFSLFYVFFIAIAFGMSVIEDDNVRVGALLHSTPLSPSEYMWGRFLGQLAAYVVIATAQLAILMLFMQLYPVEAPEKVRGAFVFGDYLWPTLVFLGVPIVFFGGVSFALGSMSRQSVLVFLLPVATLLGCVFFIWNFSPEWLPQWANRALQAIDPTGVRWLTETYLKVDRGASYYNSTPIALDGLMLANRVALLVLGFAAVGLAAWRESRRLRGSHRVAPSAALAAITEADRDDVTRRSARLELDREVGPVMPVSVQAAPSAFASARAALSAEVRELRRAPGLILFVPLIVLQVVGAAIAVPGAFDTPLLLTPGGMAASTFNTVTLLSILLILFYATESLARDEKARTTAIVGSSGSRLGAIVAGRLIANCAVVLIAVLGGVYLGVCISFLVQGIRSGVWIAPSPVPFLVV